MLLLLKKSSTIQVLGSSLILVLGSTACNHQTPRSTVVGAKNANVSGKPTPAPLPSVVPSSSPSNAPSSAPSAAPAPAPAASASPAPAPAPAPAASAAPAGPATPLQTAASTGDLQTMKSLLSQPGANPDSQDSAGNSLVKIAAKHNHLDAVKFLISRGAKIDPVDPAKPTVPFMVVKHYSAKDASEAPTDDATLKRDATTYNTFLDLGSNPSFVSKSAHSLFELAVASDLRMAKSGKFMKFTESLVHHGFSLSSLKGTKAVEAAASGPSAVSTWIVDNLAVLKSNTAIKMQAIESLVSNSIKAGADFASAEVSGKSGLTEAIYNFTPIEFKQAIHLLVRSNLDLDHLNPQEAPFIALAAAGTTEPCKLSKIPGRSNQQCFDDIMSNLELYIESKYSRDDMPQNKLIALVDHPYKDQGATKTALAQALTGASSPRLLELLILMGSDVRASLELAYPKDKKTQDEVLTKLKAAIAPEVAQLIDAECVKGTIFWQRFAEYRKRWKSN